MSLLSAIYNLALTFNFAIHLKLIIYMLLGRGLLFFPHDIQLLQYHV